MTTSSIPAAIDYLYGLAVQAAATVGVGTKVCDGWPASFGPSMFAVGSDRPPEAGDGTNADAQVGWAGLGARACEENYGVPCWIYSASGSTDQAGVRKASFALWDAFYPLFRADLTLGGALTQMATITTLRLEGPKSVEEAADGRYALILFTVQCENRY